LRKALFASEAEELREAFATGLLKNFTSRAETNKKITFI
jgi:hypothetical protein